MNFDTKLALALKELESRKVSHYRTMPLVPVYARHIGLKIKPAHYRSFLSNVICYSSIFGIFIAIPVIPFDWSDFDLVYEKNNIVSPLAYSLLFGLTIAIYCKLSAGHHCLTPWDKLSE